MEKYYKIKCLLTLIGLGSGGKRHTYQEIGHQLGLSKQRIEQIEQKALAKLQARAFGSYYDLLRAKQGRGIYAPEIIVKRKQRVIPSLDKT